MRHSLFSIITLLIFSFMLTACSEAQRTNFDEEFKRCDDGTSVLEGQACPIVGLNDDGTVTNPDGTTTNTDGSITDTVKGTITYPDGRVTNLDGTISTKDGITTDTVKGTITYPDGRVTDLFGDEIFIASYKVNLDDNNVFIPLIGESVTLNGMELIPTYQSNGDDVAYDSLTAIVDAGVVTNAPLTLQGLAVRMTHNTTYIRKNASSPWEEQSLVNEDVLQIDKKIDLSGITATALTFKFFGNGNIEEATLHLENDYKLTGEEIGISASSELISGTFKGNLDNEDITDDVDNANDDDDVILTVDRKSIFGLTDGENNSIASNYMVYVSWASHKEAKLGGGSDKTTETDENIAGATIVGFETETIPTNAITTNNMEVSFTGKGKGSYGSVQNTRVADTSYEDASTGYDTVFGISATVDFGMSTIAINSEDTMKCSDNSDDFSSCTQTAVTELDFMMPTKSYKVAGSNVNAISSDMVTTKLADNNLSGTLDARFYGSASWELGGVFSLTESNDDNVLYYFGAFGAQRRGVVVPLEFGEMIVEKMVSNDNIATAILANDPSYSSLTEAVTGSADGAGFTMNGLAVVKDDTVNYTRAPNRVWVTNSDRAQNISLARLTGAAVSLTFDGSANISGVTVYVEDNQYTAAINTPVSGMEVANANITSRNGLALSDSQNADFEENINTATISVNRDAAFFGFDSNYMTYVNWNIMKGIDKLDGDNLVLEDDIYDIGGAMIAGFETSDLTAIVIDDVEFTGKGSGTYRNATNSYDTVFDITATVNFSAGNVTFISRDTECKISNCGLSNGELGWLALLTSPISYTDNNINGNIATTTFGGAPLDLTGMLNARFYGGMIEELGGTFTLTNASSESYYYGVFGVEKTDFLNKNNLTALNDSNRNNKRDNILAIRNSVQLTENIITDADNTISIDKMTNALIMFDYNSDGTFVNNKLELYLTDKKYEVKVGHYGSNSNSIANATNGGAINASTASNDDDKPHLLVFSKSENYFDNSSNPTAQQYMAMVHWQVSDDANYDDLSDDAAITYQSYGSGIVGFETDMLPTVGTAVVFSGAGRGVYTNATEGYDTKFDITATVNFEDGHVSINSSNTIKYDSNILCSNSCMAGDAVSSLDFTTGATAVSYISNSISGNVALTNDVTFDGTIDARFYGPNAEELGGTFSMQSSDNAGGYIGFFGAKQ